MSERGMEGGGPPLAGEMAMARLADRLATLTPPPLDLARLHAVSMPRTAAAGLTVGSAIAARAAERARRSRSVLGLSVDGFVAACRLLPYALVALLLRLTIAWNIFRDGQSRLDGPRLSLHLPPHLPFDWPIRLPNIDVSLLLPAQVRADMIADLATQVPPIPLPPLLSAYLISYAEFALPICLVLGFATRFAALGLLLVTALLAVVAMPHGQWSEPIEWAAILLVLISLGGGALSADGIIRSLARR